MRVRCLVLLGAVLLLCPGTARADWWDIWGFLDQLSGPGPFKSNKTTLNPEIRIPVTLFAPQELKADAPALRASIARNIARPRVVYPAVRFTALRTEEGTRRFLDSTAATNTRPVRMRSIDPSIMVRAGGAVDLGFGLSFMRFSGDGFDSFWKTGVILPKTTFSPLALGEDPSQPPANPWRHFVNVALDGILVPGFNGSSPKEFNDPTTKYNTSGRVEYLIRAGVQLDVELAIVEGVRKLRRR